MKKLITILSALTTTFIKSNFIKNLLILLNCKNEYFIKIIVELKLIDCLIR